MDHTDKQSDTSPSREPDVVAEALAYTRKAEELRGAAIKQLLEQRERIEKDLKALGYSASLTNGSSSASPSFKADRGKGSGFAEAEHAQQHTKRFKDMKLADIGRILLRERGILHGTDIEKLAKAGGFKGGANHFQNYMPVAFKRDGGFENIGGNKWKLKEPA